MMYEELISRLNRYTRNCVADKLDADFADAVQQAAKVIGRKKGYWYDKGSMSCRCSNCGCKSIKEYSFCPNCGSDNRVKKGKPK